VIFDNKPAGLAKFMVLFAKDCRIMES